jgi:hypothetical protein
MELRGSDERIKRLSDQLREAEATRDMFIRFGNKANLEKKISTLKNQLKKLKQDENIQR